MNNRHALGEVARCYNRADCTNSVRHAASSCALSTQPCSQFAWAQVLNSGTWQSSATKLQRPGSGRNSRDLRNDETVYPCPGAAADRCLCRHWPPTDKAPKPSIKGQSRRSPAGLHSGLQLLPSGLRAQARRPDLPRLLRICALPGGGVLCSSGRDSGQSRQTAGGADRFRAGARHRSFQLHRAAGSQQGTRCFCKRALNPAPLRRRRTESD